MKSKIFIAAVVVALAACKKMPLPQGEQGEPVFYAQCEVDGKQWKAEAGSDNYILDANVGTDSSSFYTFRADLRRQGCQSGCGYEVSIIVNDVSNSNQARNADSALRTARYRYSDLSLTPELYNVRFVPESSPSGGNYQWTYAKDNQLFSYNGYSLATRMGLAASEVTLSYDNGSGCAAQHASNFSPGGLVHANIRAVRENSPTTLAYTYSAAATGSAPYSYLWEFNDGSADHTSTLPVVKHVYLPKASGNYLTKLTLTDADMNSCVAYYEVPASLQGGCEANFNTSFEPVKNSMWFSKITVLLSYDGKVYSSRNVSQPAESSFEITEVSDYDANAQGHPTKKLKVKFNCLVSDGSTVRTVNNGEAVIAVAYR